MDGNKLDIDAILGGLESAFSRGESLQKAMISFYNAGYKKEDIEEAARTFQEIHKRKFAELGVEPVQKKKAISTPVSDYSSKTPQEAQKPIEPKTKIFKSEIVAQEQEAQKLDKSKEKKTEKTEQVVSKYGGDYSRDAEDFKEALIQAISSIKQVPVYAEQKNKPVVIQQRVSEYESEPPTPLSKAITFLLIFLLLLLLGLLGAVFFFKEELIELFNSLSIR